MTHDKQGVMGSNICHICVRGEQIARSIRIRKEAGESQTSIAKSLGVCTRTVIRHLQRCEWGVPEGVIPLKGKFYEKELERRKRENKASPNVLRGANLFPPVPRGARSAAQELFIIGWRRLHLALANNSSETILLAWTKALTAIQECLARSEPTLDELKRMAEFRPEAVAIELERIAQEMRSNSAPS